MSIQWGGHCEWDPRKAVANERAHGISFPEAATVFDDLRAMTRDDADAVHEVRFVTLGLSCFGRLVVVVWTPRGLDSIRLISAWKANARQRGIYAQDFR